MARRVYFPDPMGSIVTRTARVWLDSEGIIQEVDAPGCDQTLDDARANVAANREIGQGHPRPALIDMTQVKSTSFAAQRYYAGPEAHDFLTAAALVVANPLSRVLGNFVIGLKKSALPIRVFTSIDDAQTWLRRFVVSGPEAA